MRNSICRVRERKIALCGLPIYWKKLEVTIWLLFYQVRKFRHRPHAERSI